MLYFDVHFATASPSARSARLRHRHSRHFDARRHRRHYELDVDELMGDDGTRACRLLSRVMSARCVLSSAITQYEKALPLYYLSKMTLA